MESKYFFGRLRKEEVIRARRSFVIVHIGNCVFGKYELNKAQKLLIFDMDKITLLYTLNVTKVVDIIKYRYKW